MKQILYSEGNYKYPYKPHEDASFILDSIIAIADGVTHDPLPNGLYPNPSDSAEIASLVVKKLVNYTSYNSSAQANDFVQTFLKVNADIADYNQNRKLYIERESNGYDFACAVAVLVRVEEKLLTYACLDDCSLLVFDSKSKNKINLSPFVKQSSKFFDTNFNWSLLNTESLEKGN